MWQPLGGGSEQSNETNVKSKSNYDKKWESESCWTPMK